MDRESSASRGPFQGSWDEGRHTARFRCAGGRTNVDSAWAGDSHSPSGEGSDVRRGGAVRPETAQATREMPERGVVVGRSGLGGDGSRIRGLFEGATTTRYRRS